MNINWNKKYFTVSVYALAVISISIIVYGIVNNFGKFQDGVGAVLHVLSPVFYGFVIAYLLNPVLKWMERWLFPKLLRSKLGAKGRRYLGILITYILFLSFLSLLSSIIIPQIAASLAGILGQLPEYFNQLENWLRGLAVDYNFDQVNINSLFGYAQSFLSNSFNKVNTVVSSTVSTFLNLFVGVIISIYLLAGKETFFAQLKKALYGLFKTEKVDRTIAFGHSVNTICNGFIYGKILDSLIIGLLSFLGMSLLRIPYALLVSVIVGVTNIIPYFGPIIGAVPGTLIVLFVSPVKALIFLIFILVLQQFDGNVLGPRILGETVGISSFWVLLSVVVFGGLFGFIGMLLAVPVMAVLYSVFRTYLNRKLEQKQLSTDLETYASEENPMKF